MFISFEGIDLSGKTTQCRLLEEWLASQNLKYISVREPGGTSISEQIRAMLLDLSHAAMDPVTELLLFSAARSQLIVEKIFPALQSGVIVLADRFHDSTTAYQGYGRGLPLESIRHMHALATHGIAPDVTFFFDLDYEETARRRAQRLESDDRMEAAGRDFFTKVRSGYLAIAEREAERFVVIDAMKSREDISLLIRQKIGSIVRQT
jgi:dTMP kinase